jgi:hypothetical protein
MTRSVRGGHAKAVAQDRRRSRSPRSRAGCGSGARGSYTSAAPRRHPGRPTAFQFCPPSGALPFRLSIRCRLRSMTRACCARAISALLAVGPALARPGVRSTLGARRPAHWDKKPINMMLSASRTHDLTPSPHILPTPCPLTKVSLRALRCATVLDAHDAAFAARAIHSNTPMWVAFHRILSSPLTENPDMDTSRAKCASSRRGAYIAVDSAGQTICAIFLALFALSTGKAQLVLCWPIRH